ncbi:hypothetical protein INR49_001293 [Caranx melampygus]|nr:hypothetical protein INR49_001293 [Caranx melampygus]
MQSWVKVLGGGGQAQGGWLKAAAGGEDGMEAARPLRALSGECDALENKAPGVFVGQLTKTMLTSIHPRRMEGWK